ALYAGENIRAIGTFGAVDIMAMSTVVSFGLLIALGFGLASAGRRRVLLLLVAVVLLLPLVLSLSRGSLIAVVCAAAVVLAVHHWRAAVLTVLVVAALGVVLVGGFGLGADTVGERVASIGSSVDDPDRSVTDRYDLWTAAIGMWREHPLTGVGLQNFPEYRDSYAPLRLSSGSDVGDPDGRFRREPLLSPHNMYLLVASEQGTVGILAFGGLLAALAAGTVRRLLRTGTPIQRAPGLCALGLLTWLLVDFGYADIGGPSSVLTAVVLGLVASWALAVVPAPEAT
ncbi:MAG: O-antigen ligase family protein, partial [Actinomycetota bacterium]|nr:O-antigen ligase family protein [Actinomycetota bacterium]